MTYVVYSSLAGTDEFGEDQYHYWEEREEVLVKEGYYEWVTTEEWQSTSSYVGSHSELDESMSVDYSGEGTYYKDSSDYTVTCTWTCGCGDTGREVITVPAYEEPSTYNVTLNANGGTFSSGSTTYTAEYEEGETYLTPTRTGYTFSGYSTSSTTSGTIKSCSSSHEGGTLYASWKANTYTLTFNANGGSVSPTSKTITYGSTFGTLPTPTRTGYTFAGWMDGGTAYGTNAIITSSTVVKYAGAHAVTILHIRCCFAVKTECFVNIKHAIFANFHF